MDLTAAMPARMIERIRPGAGVVLALALAAWPALARAQEAGPDRAKPPAVSGAPSFEVLNVTTGSGSGRTDDKKALRVEILDFGPKSPAEAAEAALAEADPGLTQDQRAAKARAAALETALELWHSRILSEYSRDLGGRPDPFMPSREVRGAPSYAGASYDPSLPPILRLDLSQLKLVAITIRSGAAGAEGALASFEDGSGASYILRPGDRIGRRQGRITGITSNTVTVEEPPPGPGAPARLTEIRLGGLDNSGRTRQGGQRAHDLADPYETTGQGEAGTAYEMGLQ